VNNNNGDNININDLINRLKNDLTSQVISISFKIFILSLGKNKRN
jgi:hypothetical protein